MTREEAIKEIKSWTAILIGMGDKCSNDTAEAQNMAIKALEQEPCEDAISRQDLDKALYECFHEEDSPNNITDVCLGAVRNFIKNFPSATPQPKIGWWWERNTYPQECRCWDCSECQETVFERTNYCPNCGLKMQEVVRHEP